MLYEDDLGLREKITMIAKEVYGANCVNFHLRLQDSWKSWKSWVFVRASGMYGEKISIPCPTILLCWDVRKILRSNVREAYVSAGADLWWRLRERS